MLGLVLATIGRLGSNHLLRLAGQHSANAFPTDFLFAGEYSGEDKKKARLGEPSGFHQAALVRE
jgi:hypothetical protein